MKGRVEKDIILIKDKLNELQQEIPPFKKYIKKEVPMLENLLEYYRKSNGETKKKILCQIFAEKLVLEKGKVSAPVFTESVMLTFKIGDSLRKDMKDFLSIENVISIGIT
jgi:hypothetical protein